MSVFLDSNIVLYAFSSEPVRSEIAQSILETEFHISVQVLNEFINVSRKKLQQDWDQIEQGLRFIRRVAHSIHPLDEQTNLLGFALARKYNFQVYDAMIVAVALQSECRTLFSEDMQDGLIIEDHLTIRNPFA